MVKTVCKIIAGDSFFPRCIHEHCSGPCNAVVCVFEAERGFIGSHRARGEAHVHPAESRELPPHMRRQRYDPIVRELNAAIAEQTSESRANAASWHARVEMRSQEEAKAEYELRWREKKLDS